MDERMLSEGMVLALLRNLEGAEILDMRMEHTYGSKK